MTEGQRATKVSRGPAAVTNARIWVIFVETADLLEIEDANH